MKIPAEFDEDVPFIPGVELTSRETLLAPEEVTAIAVALQELLPPYSADDVTEWGSDALVQSISRRI